MARRIIETESNVEEEKYESGLRPRFLKDYIGQQKLKDMLKVYIDAAKMRGDALDHGGRGEHAGLGRADRVGGQHGVELLLDEPGLGHEDAGDAGGEVVFEGTPEDLLKADTFTARYI